MTETAHTLEYAASRRFAPPPEIVFDAVTLPALPPADPGTPGAILEVTPKWGMPGEVGYQALLRVNWGVVDLHMREMVIEARRPERLVLNRRPEAFTVYDPSERTPPLDSEIPDDPMAAFRRAFGAVPPATRVTLEFASDGGGTGMTVSLQLLMDVKPGWLARRVWRRQNRKEIEAMFARVQALI